MDEQQNVQVNQTVEPEKGNGAIRSKIAVIAVLVLVILAAGYFAWSKFRPLTVDNIAYLGVHFGPFSTTAQSAAAMLFDRWGDSRVPYDYVLETFPSATQEYTLQDLAHAFEEKGYVADILQYKSVRDIRSHLKNEIPVVVELRLMPERELSPTAFFVVVGNNPLRRSVVTFENMFGYNYELSYEDFENMSVGPIGGRMLVVEPTEEILPALNQFTTGSIDLVRPEFLDSAPLQEYYRKMSLINMLENRSWDYDSRDALNEIANSAVFADELPPRQKVVMYTLLALEQLRANDVEGAEQTIIGKALPINKDLDKEFRTWPEIPGLSPESAFPWRTLGTVHYAQGELDNARNAYQRALALDPSDEYSQRRLEELE